MRSTKNTERSASKEKEIQTDGVAIVQLHYMKVKAMRRAAAYSDKVRRSNAIKSWLKSFSIGIGIGIVFFTVLLACGVW